MKIGEEKISLQALLKPKRDKKLQNNCEAMVSLRHYSNFRRS
jgi:hypothetical protein